MDANLFNGEYYEHKITDPKTFEFLNMEDPNVQVPAFQLGKGCLVDQLVGQYMAHICGLGYLGNKEHIQTTLESIMKYNYVKDFSRHFNNMRSYVLGDESGLLMASWPKGRLEVPFPYFAEEFNLHIAAVVNREPDSQPSARELADTIRLIRDTGVTAVFAEPQYSESAAQVISGESGATLYLLDPGVTGEEDPDAYLHAMEKNLEILKEALA